MFEASLLVIQGADQGYRFELGGPELQKMRIGRGVQNDIRVLDTEVSREHAILSLEDRKWILEDLGSSNGTFVNGDPIRHVELRRGDQVQLGRTILLFDDGTEEKRESVADRISLLEQADPSDQSRIVGRADLSSSDGDSYSHPGFQHAGDNLAILYQITEEAVRPSVSLDQSLQRILDLTLEAVGADRGCMLVADSRTDRIEPRIISHRPFVDVNERMPISTSIVEFVIQHGHGVRTSNASADSRFEGGNSIVRSGIREAMCVPMQGRYELMGVMYLDTTNLAANVLTASEESTRFNDQLLALLLAIGRQSALAIENNRYQEALVSSERLAAIGQTIALLSHHIKNILQGVRGGSYLIDMGLREQKDELVRKGWTIVDRNQDRIYNLVMDMLTFSKERQPELKLASLNDLLTEICDLMATRAEQHSVNLIRRFGEPMPPSMFDPEGIHRAILNIVTNAIDVLSDAESGEVIVTSAYDPQTESLSVEVRDNGPGIHPEEIPRLFNLFESTKGARGTGLGLAVSRKILQEHGGDIAVTTQPGQGAIFRLTWPYVNEEAESPVDVPESGKTQSWG